ncbi:MAG TPA: glycosyltransferase family 1 protein [Thermoleophilaceae bacterium]|nr:glycosyltransferase family 1 protein [Thermoleophilaceae bacterium]
MRVGFDARYASQGLGIGGFARELAARLAACDGLELVWFGPPQQAPRGSILARFGWRPYPLLDTRAGHSAARSARVDVMHFTGNTGWTTRRALPTILTVHDLIFMDTTTSGRRLRQVVGHRYARRNVARAVDAADIVATPSEEVARKVRVRLRAARVEIIPQGVDAPPSVNAVASDSPYVVAFAARDPRKETTLAVQAWAAARETGWNLKLLAGAGLPKDLPGHLLEDRGQPSIEVLPYLPRQELWTVVAGARALLYPSRDEGFGLPVLEAMTAGVPVITGLAPATMELAGEAAIMIDRRDPKASAAAALVRLAKDPALAAGLADRGRRRATDFSWERTAARYVQLYEEVLS